MTRDDLHAKLKQILVEQLGLDDEEVTLDSNLSDDLGADSLDFIEVVMAAEDTFGIQIDDEETETIATVKDALDLLVKKVPDGHR